MNKDQFYCVGCGKLTGNAEADKLFTTGFYRIVYRLGCCKACLKRAAEEDRQQRSRTLPQDAPPYGRFSAIGFEAPKERFLVFN
ncbi:hypothetical protein SAMN02799624_02520 [Paenibacillus sp. UNC496MF]|uniref:hypothetical protein n=1 Tax=Paenibacillus sp. UNC496MF TaxID=1502753 RepID=UPI0008EE71C6|nr:hypothetical protein [Paenibacillus sp. UNC496MF]SFI89055.1 hypothetical protein SAMN02799624_02520 [Paenibacillus sp. UNC496MF]